MLDKIIEFLQEYCYTEECIEKVGKYKAISAMLSKIISAKLYTADELRKELSIYIKRIISVKEFDRLLDYERAEYELLLYE